MPSRIIWYNFDITLGYIVMDAHSESNEKKPISLDNTNTEINFFASTNFRNTNRKFGIKLDDRRRHMYVVGKTGMGKTTLLENMVLNDIYAGHGVGVVDPHGDFAEKIIDYIPPNRINDVVYFNPSDIDYPIGFNILETIDPRYRHLVASGLMGVFKKIWPDVWSARMEYILNNTLLALLEFPNTTLLGINRLLADDAYRKRVVRNLKDPVIRSFWETEFAGYNDRYKQEAVAPVQNKIGQFLSASVIRNIVAQVKSRINIREIMDTKKIFIMNLSKGRIGEDNSRLLGGMLITKIQLAAMERVDTIEKDRKDFFLYVDEFQNFATESFSNILSEARKYRLDLIMAHQYMEQLDETVLAAVIGNVGTLVTFRVGSTDAEILAKEFAPTFLETDLVNLTKFQIYLKLMIDGVASQPFSANTLSPINLSTGSLEKVVRVSRERYATNRENIEDKIMRWTGIDSKGSDADAEDGSDDRDEDYTEDEEGMPVLITPIKKEVPEPVEPPAPPSKSLVVVAAPVAREPEKKPEPAAPQKPKQDQPKPQSQPQSGRNDNNKKNNNNQNSQNNQNNNKNKDRNRDRNKQQNSEKNKKPLDIRQSTPVALVDADQKGISLSQAMQTNKQAVPASESFKSSTSQVVTTQEVYDKPENIEQEDALTAVAPKPIATQPAPVQEEKPSEIQIRPIPSPQAQDVSGPSKGHIRHSSGHIPPNKVVKIDDNIV